jgi:hypothetical protein
MLRALQLVMKRTNYIYNTKEKVKEEVYLEEDIGWYTQ